MQFKLYSTEYLIRFNLRQNSRPRMTFRFGKTAICVTYYYF